MIPIVSIANSIGLLDSLVKNVKLQDHREITLVILNS